MAIDARALPRSTLSALLAETPYIGAPETIIRRVLNGEFSIDSQGNRRVIDNYFQFHSDHANYPRPNQALWIYSQMARWGQVALSDDAMEAAKAAYRPDIYQAALGTDNSPNESDGHEENERFMDGLVFDPANIDAYVEKFEVRSPAVPSTASTDA